LEETGGVASHRTDEPFVTTHAVDGRVTLNSGEDLRRGEMSDRPNPFDDIGRLFEELNRTFDDVAVPTDLHAVPVDVAETDTEVVVTADLPGFEKADISITLSERVLSVEAERDETTEDDATYHRRERRRRRLSRTIRLPAEVDEDSARAEYATGVLTVTIQRERDEGDDSRQIDIE
jgi:HSP20 family protein